MNKNMKLFHPSYRQLLGNISKIKFYFDVEFLTLPNETFKLVRFSKNIFIDSPLLVIMAGCHGEEPMPSLSIFKNYKLISETAKKHRVNLVIYPLVNPWGFDRNKRLNRKGLNCNSNWIHREKGAVADEVKIISKDIKKLKPLIFANMHEDAEKNFYIFSFGDRGYENHLIDVGKKYFPILQDGKYGALEVKNGVVFNHHDGSAEDFMFHCGCKFSCCTETPSSRSSIKRIKCNRDLILRLIKLSKGKFAAPSINSGQAKKN